MPNEVYAQNMEYRHQYDEIVKHFAEGQLKEAGANQKDLQLHNVNIASYYTDKYALWLDFRTIVHVPNFAGVAGSEDFACATLPTTPLDFQGKIKIFVTLPS